MAILEILKYPDKKLKKQSKRIKQGDDEIKKLLEDMEQTMIFYLGVGLAAPQVNVLKRAIIASDAENIYKFVNPVIVDCRGETILDEGCLCIPGMIATVKRYQWIKLKAQNEEGKKITLEAEDFFARVIQHEIDHLNGILIIDRAEPGTFRKIEKHEAEKIDD